MLHLLTHQIRMLFAIILTTCFPSNPIKLWGKCKDYMSEDILHRLRRTNLNPDIQFTPDINNEALIMIEDIRLAIVNKALIIQLGMVAPIRSANDIYDRDLQREQHFDVNELHAFAQSNPPSNCKSKRLIVFSRCTFQHRKLACPIRPTFATTINKAQGQSLQVCGLNLGNPCF